MPLEEVYAAPRLVQDLESCLFYHTMDLPGFGPIEGEWDLRAGVEDYLGHVELRGKRALDVGTASGFLAFAMESRGASVVAYDLSPGADLDIVPFAGSDVPAVKANWREGLGRVHSSFWLAHRVLESRVRMAYGSVYSIPEGLGKFDLSVFGSILLHLRDPFRALEQVAAVTGEAMIVTDLLPRRSLLIPAVARWFGPSLNFLPDPARQEPKNAWWLLTPRAIVRMLGVLGFPAARITFHTQPCRGKQLRLFTVVATRER